MKDTFYIKMYPSRAYVIYFQERIVHFNFVMHSLIIMNSLVGYTGFVGSNLVLSKNFDNLYNSKNINTAFESQHQRLIYAGVPAHKFIANQNASADFEIINTAIENIKKIAPQKLVLISTVDIYSTSTNVNEDSIPNIKELQPYGYNRYFLEQWVENNIKDYLIVRLPGLYGKNIKKNFIYDLINIIPSILSLQKINSLKQNFTELERYYTKLDNGFYQCNPLTIGEKLNLKSKFLQLGYSALNFTDSRGQFQFYNLDYLWEHIEFCLNNNIRKINLTTEPVRISELYHYITGNAFTNELPSIPPNYNITSKYASIFGNNDYIFDKQFILQDIKNFVEENQQ